MDWMEEGRLGRLGSCQVELPQAIGRKYCIVFFNVRLLNVIIYYGK